MGRFDGFWGDPYAPRFTWKNRWTRIGLAFIASVVLLTIIIVAATPGKKKPVEDINTGEPPTPTDPPTQRPVIPTDPTEPPTTEPPVEPPEPPTKELPDNERFDCTPDLTNVNEVTKDECEKRGCIFAKQIRSLNVKNSTLKLNMMMAPQPNLDVKCYYPNSWTNYNVTNTMTEHDGSVVALLTKSTTDSGFDDTVHVVRVQVIPLDDSVVRIKVTDVSSNRWEAPIPVLNIHPSRSIKEDQKLYSHEISDLGVLKITRKRNKAVIFRANLRQLIFADQFIQMTVNVPSNELYGLGEHYDRHLKKVVTNGDKAGRKLFKFHQYGYLPEAEKPSYGHHPFYLMYEFDGDAHGVWLHNINSMQIEMTSTPAITYRVIGGILDFFVFMGPTPDEVMEKKADLIGKTPLPPLWSLGFHMCKSKFKNVDEVKDVYERNVKEGLFMDAQCLDIDYMDDFNMFTYDKDKFKDLPLFINQLHGEKRRFVPIIHPAVDGTEDSQSAGWQVYKDGHDREVFIRNPKGGWVKGRVWNTKESVFPDFSNPRTNEWWMKHLKRFNEVINYDGLWIDMNEPSSFITGQVGGCLENKYDRPQFNPIYPAPLENYTICMSSEQYLSNHYNLHNMYGYLESKATFEALKEIRGERPFILSRSTAVGSGSYVAHWTGDVESSWEALRLSISGILDFNLFGIPLVGADICGFVHPSNEELCMRWSSLGAFYTFSRNHNDGSTMDQDPASPELGGKEGKVFRANLFALEKRYTLLPFLYSLFFRNSLTGEPVLRSLRFNFPKEESLADNDWQFMWGKSLLINGITEKGKTDMTAQFPPGKWFDFKTGKVMISNKKTENLKITVPETEINLSVRGGTILPTHDPKTTTVEQQKGLFNLWCYLDDNDQAFGELYWDDGVSLNTKEFEDYSHIKFEIKENTLISLPLLTNYKGKKYKGIFMTTMRVKQVKIHGVKKPIKSVTLADQELTFDWDPDKQVLTIPKESSDKEWNTFLLKHFTIMWKFNEDESLAN
jgi:lysosomal alpha-glucosidase